jgi:hypothetical protein
MGDWTTLTVAKIHSKRESENDSRQPADLLKKAERQPQKKDNLTLSQGMLHMKTVR